MQGGVGEDAAVRPDRVGWMTGWSRWVERISGRIDRADSIHGACRADEAVRAERGHGADEAARPTRAPGLTRSAEQARLSGRFSWSDQPRRPDLIDGRASKRPGESFADEEE